jgi:peptide/nickel transport system substrate-binding protein
MVSRGAQVALVGALVGTLVGCESPARVKPWRHAPDPTAEAARAPGSPALADLPGDADVHASRGHTLRVHVDADPGRLTAIVEPTTWARRITLGTVFEPLLRYVPPDGAGPGRFAPRLARSWRVMPNGLEIRLELEPNVTFHDGHPMTSSDVQFTLDAVRDPRKGIDHLRPMLDDVEAIELITSHEVRLRLKRPSSWALRALAEIPILPMHVYDGSLLAGGALVGTGPWKFGSNKNGVVHLSRFDKYWAGPVAIADVEFVYQPDAAAALMAAKRGELDIVPALTATHWKAKQGSSPGLASQFDPLQLKPPRLRYLAFNAARSPLDDARVRRAIALLVDRRAIASKALDGLARPALWPVWPGGPVDGAEVAPPEIDVATADKLLADAGWIDRDKKGVREKDGKPLKLVLIGPERPPPRDPSDKNDREMITAVAKRSQVIIEVKALTDNALEKRLSDGNYDIVEMTWGGMVDSDITSLVTGRTLVRVGGGKFAAGTSPRLERALDAMGAAWDPAERTKLAGELTGALAEVFPIAGIVADSPHGLVHRRVRGLKVWDGWIDLAALSLDPKL